MIKGREVLFRLPLFFILHHVKYRKIMNARWTVMPFESNRSVNQTAEEAFKEGANANLRPWEKDSDMDSLFFQFLFMSDEEVERHGPNIIRHRDRLKAGMLALKQHTRKEVFNFIAGKADHAALKEMGKDMMIRVMKWYDVNVRSEVVKRGNLG